MKTSIERTTSPPPRPARRLPAWPRRLALGGLAVAAAAVVGLGGPPGAAANEPRIRFEKTTHDFGELRADEKVRFDWVFHNDGDAPLSILNTKTSCGCTMSLADAEPVPPGGSGTIKIEFDPAGMQGSVRKTLAVTSDDPTKLITRLTIKAHVIPTGMPASSDGHPPITGQSLLMGQCASCHATPAAGKSGAELYDAVCVMCHGPQAVGGRAPGLRHPSYLEQRSDGELFDGIAYGTANPRMPGFSEMMGGPLSEPQIRSLVRLLREWGPSQAEPGGEGRDRAATGTGKPSAAR